MATEETVRYYGVTEADRQAAFETDAPMRAADGWRASAKRTEFAFGKPGMNLVVTWAKDGRAEEPADGVAGPAGADATSPSAPATGGFNLNAAIAAATRDLPPAAPATVPEVDLTATVDMAEAAAAEAPEAQEADDSEAGAGEGAEVASAFSPERARTLFGPNGEDVAWVLDSLPTIDSDTAEAIARAWQEVSDERRLAADFLIEETYPGPPQRTWMENAEALVDEWLESLDLEGNDEALFDMVGGAAIDAVDALVFEDELDDETFDTLYGPWQSVMEPGDEDDDPDEEDGSDDQSEETDLEQDGVDPVEEAAAEAEDEAEFGPNTGLVVQFFETLAGLSEDQVRALSTPADGSHLARLDRSRRRLEKTIDEKPRWQQQCAVALGEVDRWCSRQAGVHFDYSNGEGSFSDRSAARQSVEDGVQALLMADLLHPGDADRLYEAWSAAVGKPEMPEYEDE